MSGLIIGLLNSKRKSEGKLQAVWKALPDLCPRCRKIVEEALTK